MRVLVTGGAGYIGSVVTEELLNDGHEANVFNLGCGGEGYSVREVIDAAREVTGREVQTQVIARRPGDPAVLIASSEKIKHELGWQPEFQDLGVIIESAWKWLSKHPQGYGE